MTGPTEPEFRSSYQGATDYRINGAHFQVRHALYPVPSASADAVPEDLASVGTVRGQGIGSTLFPPPEVMRHFPGYVPARYNPESRRIEYQDALPDVLAVPGAQGRVTYYAAAFAAELQRLGCWPDPPA
jgi:hypothetical protein